MNKINTNKLISLLEEKWGETLCPMCGENNFEVTKKVFKLRDYHQSFLCFENESSVMPVLPVICTNCGNTILINAITIGLIAPTIERNNN